MSNLLYYYDLTDTLQEPGSIGCEMDQFAKTIADHIYCGDKWTGLRLDNHCGPRVSPILIHADPVQILCGDK